jgi:hypothetical protein
MASTFCSIAGVEMDGPCARQQDATKRRATTQRVSFRIASPGGSWKNDIVVQGRIYERFDKNERPYAGKSIVVYRRRSVVTGTESGGFVEEFAPAKVDRGDEMLWVSVFDGEEARAELFAGRD